MKSLYLSIIAILIINIFTVWISNAEGHGVQSPPSTVISPLKMIEGGYSITDVQCNLGLLLVIKIEDNSPACVKPDIVQKLIERGWGESLQSLLASPLQMEITGLNQSYETSHTITAAVKYTGYEHGGVYPDMKILDANGTQVWNNCCIMHTETPSMHFGTFTYEVEGPLGYPAINKTGTYALVASLDNVTTTAIFDMVSSNMTQANSTVHLKNDNGVVILNNQTYYFETPNYTETAYVHPEQISFHNVNFTLFPSGFRGGLPESCGETYYWTDAKFSDGTSELLHIFAGPKCPIPPLQTYFSNHTNPQAGLTFYDGKMKLLVSTDIANSSGSYLPASFMPCDTPYSQNYTGIPALYMPANSTGKLCVRYHNLNDSPVRIGIRISEANLTNDATDITTWNDSGNNTISKGNSTVVYWIKTGNKGLYGLTVFCVPMPLAVGYDNTTLTQSSFPWLGESTWFCPEELYDFHIDSTTGIEVKYIPVK